MDFVITCIYVAFLFVRPHDWIHFLYKYHPFDFIALAAIIVLAMKLSEESSDPETSPWDCPQFISGVLIIGTVVATYASQLFLSKLWPSFWGMFKIVMPVFLLITLLNSRKRITMTIYLLLASLTLVGGHCVMQRYTGYGLGGRAAKHLEGGVYGEGSRVQWHGIFDGPNETGTLVAGGVVICLGLARHFFPSRIHLSALYLGLSPLFVLSVWWTQSRQALVMIAAGVGVMFLPRKFKWFWLSILIGGLLLGAAIKIQGRWSGFGSDESVRKRALLITKGIAVWKKYPVFGVGTARYWDHMRSMFNKKEVDRSPHNSYLIVLMENGFIGITMYMSIFAFSVMQLLYIHRCKPETVEDREDIMQARVILGLLTVVGVGAFFQNRPYVIDSFVYLGLAGAFGRRMLREHGDVVPGYFRTKWMFSLKGGAFMLGAAVLTILSLHLASKVFWHVF